MKNEKIYNSFLDSIKDIENGSSIMIGGFGGSGGIKYYKYVRYSTIVYYIVLH